MRKSLYNDVANKDLHFLKVNSGVMTIMEAAFDDSRVYQSTRDRDKNVLISKVTKKIDIMQSKETLQQDTNRTGSMSGFQTFNLEQDQQSNLLTQKAFSPDVTKQIFDKQDYYGISGQSELISPMKADTGLSTLLNSHYKQNFQMLKQINKNDIILKKNSKFIKNSGLSSSVLSFKPPVFEEKSQNERPFLTIMNSKSIDTKDLKKEDPILRYSHSSLPVFQDDMGAFIRSRCPQIQQSLVINKNTRNNEVHNSQYFKSSLRSSIGNSVEPKPSNYVSQRYGEHKNFKVSIQSEGAKPTNYHQSVFRNIHNYSRYKMNTHFEDKDERIFFRGKVLNSIETDWKQGNYRSNFELPKQTIKKMKQLPSLNKIEGYGPVGQGCQRSEYDIQIQEKINQERSSYNKLKIKKNLILQIQAQQKPEIKDKQRIKKDLLKLVKSYANIQVTTDQTQYSSKSSRKGKLMVPKETFLQELIFELKNNNLIENIEDKNYIIQKMSNIKVQHDFMLSSYSSKTDLKNENDFEFAKGIQVINENENWLKILDKIASKIVDLVEKIQNQFKMQEKLGVLATYICQIMAKELTKRRKEKENVKRKSMWPTKKSPQVESPEKKLDIYNKSVFGPHRQIFSQEFFTLVKENNVSRALHMLRRNAKLANDLDKHGRNPLHYACEQGLLSMTELLVDFGSNILLLDTNLAQSPLDLAFKFQAKNDFKDYSAKIIKLLELAQDHTKGVRNKSPYYFDPCYEKYMISIDSVQNLDDYLYQIFEMELN